MATKAGVWIDHKLAIVVLCSDVGKETKTIAFDIGQPIRSVAGSRSKNPYKPRAFVAEDTLERRLQNDRNDYYDDVISSMRRAEAILILGPGEAKGELLKRLQSKRLRNVMLEVETVDKMTDRQIAAKVSRHFAAAAAKKSGPKKQAVKQKVTQTTIGRRRKKSGS